MERLRLRDGCLRGEPTLTLSRTLGLLAHSHPHVLPRAQVESHAGDAEDDDDDDDGLGGLEGVGEQDVRFDDDDDDDALMEAELAAVMQKE